MRKIELGYAEAAYLQDVIEDYIDDRNDFDFLHLYISDKDHVGVYFELLASKEDYNLLKNSGKFDIDVLSDGGGKAGMLNSLLNFAAETPDSSILSTAPLTFILSEDLKTVYKAKSKVVDKVYEALYSHLLKRGFHKVSFYDSYFEEMSYDKLFKKINKKYKFEEKEEELELEFESDDEVELSHVKLNLNDLLLDFEDDEELELELDEDDF